MKSKAPLKTYGHRYKPYSTLPGTVNLLDSVLDDVVASKGAQTILQLQASLEKIEEVSCPWTKRYCIGDQLCQCCNEMAMAMRNLGVRKSGTVLLIRVLITTLSKDSRETRRVLWRLP